MRVHFTRYWTLARGAGCVAPAPRRLDVGDGSRARDGGRRRSLLARPRAGSRRLLQRGRPALGAASGAAGHGAHREHPRASHRRRPLPAGGVGVREGRRRGGRRDGRRGQAVASSRRPGGCAGERRPYRWLVRTEGPPPSIAAENRARGTTAWRLPGPRSLLGGRSARAGRGLRRDAGDRRRPDADGVRERPPCPHGHRARVSHGLVSAAGADGWCSRAGRSRPSRQPPCAHRFFTGLTECDWHATLSFPIPRALPSGVYIVKLHASDGAQSDCLFVVRSRGRSAAARRDPDRLV